MTRQLSDCCKAQVSVSSSDEGTSCFMCGECKQPCDLHCEIVSLNKEYVCPTCEGDTLAIAKDVVCPDCNAAGKCQVVASTEGKEQVSGYKECVDCGNIILHPKHLINICTECEIKARNDIRHDSEWRKSHGIAKRIYVDTEEYDRLKRLDENVKRRIAEQNELKQFFNSKLDYEILYLLESLYDETTQES